MRLRRSTITVPCPVLINDGDDWCPHKLEVTVDPPEPRTHDYPGSPASIMGVEGCPQHADKLSDEELWAALERRYQTYHGC